MTHRIIVCLFVFPRTGVPKETGSILALQQTVGDYCHDNDKPLLVHCRYVGTSDPPWVLGDPHCSLNSN